MKKYSLCVKINIDGKDKVYELFTAPLKHIQKYTSFCSDFKKGYTYNDKGFLDYISTDARNIFEKYNVKKENLFILENKKGELKSKKIQVLYHDDIDVVLSEINDIRQILKNYIITIDDVVNNNISEEKKEILKQLVKYCNFSLLEPRLKYINYDSFLYDSRYEKVSEKWMDLGLFSENIESLLKSVSGKFEVWQKFCLDIKKIINNNLFPNKYIIDRQKVLNDKIEDYYKMTGQISKFGKIKGFGMLVSSLIDENLTDLIKEEKNDKISEVVSVTTKKETDDEESDREYEDINLSILEILKREIDLYDDESIKGQIRELISYYERLKKVHKDLNNKELKLTEEQKVKLKEELESLQLKIASNEEILNKLLNNTATFSDAGFPIDFHI